MSDRPETMTAVRTRLETASSLGEVSRAAADLGHRLIDCDVCELFVERGGTLEREAWAGVEDTVSDQRTGRAVVERVHRTGGSFRIGDSRQDDRFDLQGDYRALLAVPLGSHGVAQFVRLDPDAFDDRAVGAAVVFGNYVAHELERWVDDHLGTNDGVLSITSVEELLNLADVIVVGLDRDGRVVFANHEARRALGYDEGNLVGRDWFDTCLPAEDRDEMRDVFGEVVTEESDAATRYENRVVTATGEELVVEWHNTVLCAADGTVRGTLSCGLDVTERKERERELRATRERYRTLLRAAPDPVFVADAETGVIVEVNEAAAAFRGQPREEVVGLHQTDLHPATETERYRDLFERHVEDGGAKRRLSDGAPIHAVTGDGDRIPVEISAEKIELERETVIFGVFRDISDQLEYQGALTGINEATRNLFRDELPDDVAGAVVETVTEILAVTGAVVYLVDEDGVLRPTADGPPEEVDSIGEPLGLEPAENVVWRAFVDGETAVFADRRTAENVYGPETPIRSGIVVPLGEYGVLIVGYTEAEPIDARAVDIVEILASTADVALERAEHEQDIETRTHQLEQRTQRLERAESINTRLRDVAQAVVQSTTRSEIERAVCAELVEDDVFAVAWIGAVDPVDDRLDVRTWAGDEQGYLDRVPLSLDESNGEPAVQTALSKTPTVVSNTAANITRESWRSEAVRRDFHSVMSVPLVYQDSLVGVLTIYATAQSAFSGVLQPVLMELGDLIAHGTTAIERKQALLSNHATELDFDIRDRGCLFLRFTRETGCVLELEGIAPQSDGSSLAFVNVRNGSTEQLLEAAEAASAIAGARLVDAEGESFVQLRFVEPFIASVLADQGITVRNISADGTACRVTVAVPPTFDVRRAVDVVATMFPKSELAAKRERTVSADGTKSRPQRALDKLTPRQREVLEVASHRGYFDSPKKASGEELAAEFGFSPSAFHRHIRAAERTLFDTIFRNDTVISRTREGDQSSE